MPLRINSDRAVTQFAASIENSRTPQRAFKASLKFGERFVSDAAFLELTNSARLHFSSGFRICGFAALGTECRRFKLLKVKIL